MNSLSIITYVLSCLLNSSLTLGKDYKLNMDKEHLIDLISNSIIFEIKDLETYQNKFNVKNYLNNRNLNQLRIISKEFIL